jgi:leucine dehydrogenase
MHNLQMAGDELPVTEVAPDALLFSNVDVLAPCALGNILTAQTIPNIQAKVIAGAANNQLATEQDGTRLTQREILYAPDYVINAGGIINVEHEYFGNSSEEKVLAEVGEIPKRLDAIFAEAKESGEATNLIADRMARRIVAEGAKG